MAPAVPTARSPALPPANRPPRCPAGCREGLGDPPGPLGCLRSFRSRGRRQPFSSPHVSACRNHPGSRPLPDADRHPVAVLMRPIERKDDAMTKITQLHVERTLPAPARPAVQAIESLSLGIPVPLGVLALVALAWDGFTDIVIGDFGLPMLRADVLSGLDRKSTRLNSSH